MRTFSCDILVLLLFVGGLLSLYSGVARASRPAEGTQQATATSSGASGVVAVVKVPRPWYAPDFVIVRKMREAIPQYRAIPGLRFKAFTLARAGGEFGGVYLWRDRAAAMAWFTPAWHRRVNEERGVKPQLRLFDVIGPVRFAADLDWAAHGDAVATLVVPRPGQDGPDDTGARVVYPIRSQQGDGRLLIWPDRKAAQSAIDAWRRGQTGQPGIVEWFDAPILMPGVAAEDAVGTASGTPGPAILLAGVNERWHPAPMWAVQGRQP